MIIGLIGKKQSGKTTLMKSLLSTRFADKFLYINFKDALVGEIKENFRELLTEISKIYKKPIDVLFDEKPPLIRALLQNYGTDVRRKDDNDYWVNKTVVGANDVFSDIIFGDIRFLNEAKAVKNIGGTLIKIERDTGQYDSHISETELDNIIADYVIQNNGTIEEMTKKFIEIINGITNK